MNSEIERLFSRGRLKQSLKGETLVYVGFPVLILYRLLKGYVKVSEKDGDDEKVVFIYVPGDIFPFTTFLSGKSVTRYTYSCLTNVNLTIITAREAKEQFKGNVKLAEEILNYTSHINDQYAKRLKALSQKDDTRRLLHTLSYLVSRVGTDHSISRLKVSLQPSDLADMACIEDEKLGKYINKLERSELIHWGDRITINREKLKLLLNKKELVM